MKASKRALELLREDPWEEIQGFTGKAHFGDDLLHLLDSKLSPGATVLELGSGRSTERMVEAGYEVYTVEEHEVYLDKTPGATYIHAPLVDYYDKQLQKKLQWYDRKALASGLPANYDVLIVDGPDGQSPKLARYGAGRYYEMFDPAVPILIDDLQQPFVYMMALTVAKKKGASDINIHINEKGRVYGWIQ